MRVGDVFNRCASWEEILNPHGWTIADDRGQIKYWYRPGKSEGTFSAKTGFVPQGRETEVMVIYSSAPEAGGFQTFRGFEKFHVYACLNHDRRKRVTANE